MDSKSLNSYIYKLLDSRYFHVCVEIQEENTNWTIYYKNLSKEDYYSIYNQPLLTSKENTIEDIHKLKKIFEKETIKAVLQNKEWFKVIGSYSSVISEIRYATISSFMWFSCLICVINLLFLNDSRSSLILTSIALILSVSGLFIGKQIDKIKNEIEIENIQKIKSMIIRNLEFRNNLQKELMKDGINKTSGKTT